MTLQDDPEMPGLMWFKHHPPTYLSPLLGCRIERWILRDPSNPELGLTSVSTWEALLLSSQSGSPGLHQRMMLLEFNQHLAPRQ